MRDLDEMLLTPDQRMQLRSDLAEIARRRLAAFDSLAFWPAPFDRVHAKDTKPWPDYQGEPVDTAEGGEP